MNPGRGSSTSPAATKKELRRLEKWTGELRTSAALREAEGAIRKSVFLRYLKVLLRRAQNDQNVVVSSAPACGASMGELASNEGLASCAGSLV